MSIDWAAFTPGSALAGGVLLGLASALFILVNGRILGISKLARLVEIYARRLQLQERMTAQVADGIVRLARPKGAMVILQAEHLCMTMRGVKKPGSKTVTSVVRGIFRKNAATRAETMALIQGV